MALTTASEFGLLSGNNHVSAGFISELPLFQEFTPWNSKSNFIGVYFCLDKGLSHCQVSLGLSVLYLPATPPPPHPQQLQRNLLPAQILKFILSRR